MDRVMILTITVVVVVTVAAPVVAHHSFAVYDSSTTVTITGSITSVTFEHPHIEARLDTGERVWRLDLPAPSRAIARGLTPDLLRVGRAATVVGWPHRSGSADLAPVVITIENQTIRLRM